MNTLVIDRPEFEPLLTEVRRRYVDTGLTYGWKSNIDKDNDYGHWNRQIFPKSKTFIVDHAQQPEFSNHTAIQDLWNWVQSTIGPRALLRCYINGYTFGTDAYAHYDDPWITKKFGADTLTETAMFYLNDRWAPDWAGETVIYNSDRDIERSILPRANRALIFDSGRLHAARPLARTCPVLRSVIVFKTIATHCVSPEIAWLKPLADAIPHSGGSFWQHLWAVSQILEQAGAPEHVIRAGLFHSIYGTEFFNSPALKDIDPKVIRDLIGDRAEWMVRDFCSFKSGRLDGIINNTRRWNNDMHIDMLFLEWANLTEQNTRGQYNAQLARINAATATAQGNK